MVLGLFFSGCSMGKQLSSTNIETTSKIAEPIIMIETNPLIEVNGKNEKEYYHFKIKNCRENGEVTQLDLAYNLEILFQKVEAVSFKLYKEDQEIELKNNKTPNIRLENGIIQEDDYQLEIIYDKTKNISMDPIIQDVQIKVHAEQVKV